MATPEEVITLRTWAKDRVSKLAAGDKPKNESCPAPIVNVTNEISLPDPPICFEHIVTYNSDGRISKITSTRVARTST